MTKESIKAGAVLLNAVDSVQKNLQQFKESYAIEPTPTVVLDHETGEETEAVEDALVLIVAINHNAGMQVMSKARQELIYNLCVEEMEESLEFLEKKMSELK